MRTLVPFYADDLDALKNWIVFLDRRFPDRRHALTSTAMGQCLPRLRVWWPDADDGTADAETDAACIMSITLAKVCDSHRRRCFGLLPHYEYDAIFETAEGCCLYTADHSLRALWQTLWSLGEPTRIDGQSLQTALRLDADATPRPAVVAAVGSD